MSRTTPSNQDAVFKLKGSMLSVTVLELTRNDLPRLDQQLARKVAQAPNFFLDTPLVLGLDSLGEHEGKLDLPALLDICRKHGLRTLALRASRSEDLVAAATLDLPLVPVSSNTARERVIEPTPAPTPAPAPAPEKPAAVETRAEPEIRHSKIIETPIRSGQQVYAPGGDLIVLSSVSAGAELLADGNIHVYGPLRGRALAGIHGNTSARIFCQQLAADLVSIAGTYKVSEDLRRSPQWGRSVQIGLSGEVLNITRL